MHFDKDVLLNNLSDMNIEISSSAIDQLDVFAGLLLDANSKFNLTNITDPRDIAVKHFADSLSVLPYIENNSSVIDIGTGAGFPGVPLLIADNSLNLTMVDSTAKKLDFINSSLDTLKLHAETVHSRAEEIAVSESYREKFDFCVSRAVASLNILCELCLPFVRPGGTFIAMKGQKSEQETDEALNAIKTLGGTVIGTVHIVLSDNSDRNLIFIKKSSSTPEAYPRHFSRISKRPL